MGECILWKEGQGLCHYLTLVHLFCSCSMNWHSNLFPYQDWSDVGQCDVLPSRVDIPAVCQCIRLWSQSTQSEMDFQVELGEVFRPTVMIHVAIGHFWLVPTLLPLHETITSLGSNLGTHCPFNTLYSNPSWDPCTICAWSPFPIPLIYILPCLYILFLTLNIN